MRRVFLLSALALTAACRADVLDLGNNPDSGASLGVAAVFMPHQHNAVALALDATRVYWSTGSVDAMPPPPYEDLTESRLVRSCAKENCAATLVTYAQSQYAWKIVVDKSFIYWATNDEGILGCPLDGCVGSPTFFADNPTRGDFAIDESFMYWYGEWSRTLQRCSLADCTGTTTVLAQLSDSGSPTQLPTDATIAVDGTYVYFISRGPSSAVGAVMKIRKDGSEPPQVFAQAHQPRSLALGPTHLAWTEHSSVGSIKSCALSGCAGAPTVIASAQAFPYLIAGADERICWFVSSDSSFSFGANHTRGELLGCPVTGCGSSPQLLATEPDWPRNVAADATHVYWTISGPMKDGLDYVYKDGAVKRVAWPLR